MISEKTLAASITPAPKAVMAFAQLVRQTMWQTSRQRTYRGSDAAMHPPRAHWHVWKLCQGVGYQVGSREPAPQDQQQADVLAITRQRPNATNRRPVSGAACMHDGGVPVHARRGVSGFSGDFDGGTTLRRGPDRTWFS